MIRVSIKHLPLVAGRRAPITILFTNAGPGTCTDVVFQLYLPPGLTLMDGRKQVKIELLPPGQVHTHRIEVQPERPGEFTLRSPNFSYQEQFRGGVRVSDFAERVSVTARSGSPAEPPGEAAPPRQVSPPAQGTRPRPAAPGPSVGVKTILYLTAAPRDMPPLRVDEEIREVRERLRLARDGHRYRLESRGAARLDTIADALFELRPFIAHFAGHGAPDGGLYLAGTSGYSELTDPGGFAEWLGRFSESVKCVIINACHSEHLAKAAARHIDCAIGMRTAVGDEAAIRFSVGFYQALASGLDVPRAFEHARGMIQAMSATNPEGETPVLFCRQ